MSKKRTLSKILRELAYESKNNIAAICSYINNKTKYSVPTYGTKDQLLHGLEGVDECVIEEAVDAVLEDSEEYEDEGDDCDEDDEDDEEDDDE